MRNKSFLISIMMSLLPFIHSCASTEPINKEKAGILIHETIEHDDYQREYIIYQPILENTSGNLPLLIALHGGGGTNQQLIKHTNHRFNQLADSEGFYVAYPQGLKKGWNDGRNDLRQFASENNIDDVGFIRKLIQQLKVKYNIDESKVFVTGISNGGFMSFRLACELRNEINAIAPLTATISEEIFHACTGSSNVGLILINGTDDPIVPYNGGYVKLFGKKRGKITSTQQTIQRWLDMLACKDEPTIQELPNIKNDGTTVTKYEYPQCENNGWVRLFRINGGGHTWPGAKSIKLKRIVGKTNEDINACEVIWDFFKYQP